MRRVLVATDALGEANLARLSRYGEAVEGWKLDEAGIRGVLPTVDAAMVFGWPSYFTRENLAKMGRLRFLQTVSVGVNQVRFRDLPAWVVVCSNAGAYSEAVGEHAWALLLAAAKRIPSSDAKVRESGGTVEAFRSDVKDIMVLRGKTLGVLGYGGIGRSVARFARAFGMEVVAFGRGRGKERGARVFRGRAGLERVLRSSDALLISLPLTRATERLMGAEELGIMKEGAVLVNVARGDIVDQKALFAHLERHPSFAYATDVWWYKDGRESLTPELPLAKLPNFIGTPHSSGPAAIQGGGPQRAAVANTILYLRGLKPKNVVDRSEYAP